MRQGILACAVLLAASTLLAVLPLGAADDAARKQDEQAIRGVAKAYQAALAKGDAKAVASFWTADGDYVDPQGETHPVSDLAAELAAAAGAGTHAESVSSKIRFLTADVAIEDGTSLVVADTGDAPLGRGQYHATWVKQGGRWRLANLIEIPAAEPADPRLSDLDWMVGTWTADKQEVVVQWNAGRTFLLRDVKVLREGKVATRGTQRIGLDPLTHKLKSWQFDSDGGYGEATWTQEGETWVGQGTGILPDGRRTSGTTVLTPDDKDHYTRQTVAARIEGKSVPDQQIRFTRQPAATR